MEQSLEQAHSYLRVLVLNSFLCLEYSFLDNFVLNFCFLYLEVIFFMKFTLTALFKITKMKFNLWQHPQVIM